MNIVCYNTKLRFSSPDLESYWLNILDTAKQCYNFLANESIGRKIKASAFNIHKELYYETREKFPSLSSQMIIKVIGDVAANIKSAKSNKHEITNFVRKSLVMQLDKRLYSRLNNRTISISCGKNKRTLCVLESYDKLNELFDKCIPHDPKIFYKDSQFWLSIPFEIPETDFPKTSGEAEVLGIDLGIKRIATTSKGVAYTDKDYLKRKRRIRFLKRHLQSKASKGSKTAKKHLKKLRNKERNVTKDFVHKLSNQILKDNENVTVFVMEDLTEIKQTTSRTTEGRKRTRHNNMISQVPFYQIKSTLTYKAHFLGKEVVTVNPAYTSQINSLTGEKDGVRKGCRYYSSLSVLDADWNASVNVAKRYKRLSSLQSFKVPKDGNLKVVQLTQQAQ